MGLLSGLRAPADTLAAAARCNRCRPSRGTRRAQQLLAAALAISAAVPIWAQSHPSPSIAQSSHVSNADGPQASAGSSGVPDYQLDRSEEDWSGLCRQANGSDDSWDPLKCIELGRPFWYVSFGAELHGSYEVYPAGAIQLNSFPKSQAMIPPRFVAEPRPEPPRFSSRGPVQPSV